MPALNIHIKTSMPSFLITVTLGILACAGTPTAAPSPQVNVPIAVINPPDIPTSLPNLVPPLNIEDKTPKINRTKYKLSVFFDYQSRNLQVEQTVQYLNQTGETLGDLLLVIEPRRYSGVFQMESLTWESGDYISRYTLKGRILEIPLLKPIPPGQSLQLNFSYSLQMPFQPSAFGYTFRQTNLADWYPHVPPYRAGEGWLFNTPAQVGEHQIYDIADYEVTIRSPEPGLIIAAPLPAQPMATGSFYRLEAARGFVWSASKEYEILEQSVGDTLLTAYVFPEHIRAGESALQTMAEALPFYESLFGDYPRSSLSLIEADFYDGYEADGLFFLDTAYFPEYFRSPNNLLTTLTAHEIAHQWWYAQVGNDPAKEPWLDEALATYSELLFYENLYPDQAGWWWQFRVTRFNNVGYVNTSIYTHTDIHAYIDAVYLRGASFLRDLRALIGDDAFFAFLKDYAAEGEYRQATADDFFTILAKHTDVDYDYLVAIYFLK